MPKYKKIQRVKNVLRLKQYWQQRRQNNALCTQSNPLLQDDPSLKFQNKSTEEYKARLVDLNNMDMSVDEDEIPNVPDSLGEIDTDENAGSQILADDPLSDYNLVIEAQHNDVEATKPRGRRLINIHDFFEKLKAEASHGSLGCDIQCLDIVSERKVGFRSTFKFKCRMCNITFFVDNNDDQNMDINNSAVASTIAIGCGLAQLQEFSAGLNLPIMSHNTFKRHQDIVANNWEKAAKKCMAEAAEEEKKIAIEEGRVNKEGIPVIDIIADGCWSKRSYKKNYSALSGAAAIIGRRTKKILFLGVKNKYCSVCVQAGKKKVQPKEHDCYKKISGASTSMESTILVEGFRSSLKEHGIIYGRIISDGDSSTYHKIREARPYPNTTVEKVECRNHLLRNLCNRLQSLTTDTKYLVKLRKILTKKRILTIRGAICKAIAHNSKQANDDLTTNSSSLFYYTNLLFEDISHVHLHAFGNHAKCKSYFCDSPGSQNNDVTRDFFTSSLWQRICLIISGVAGHARSLIHNVDSNVVECFHSVVAKYVGGKRINFSSRRGYQTRVSAAAVAFNTKRSLTNVHQMITKKTPTGGIKKLEDTRIKRSALMQKYSNKKRRIPLASCANDKNYGEASMQPDVPEDILQLMKESFIGSLKRTDEERCNIQQRTILQGNCSEWLELRRSLLTASNFGRIIKKKADTSCSNIVKDLLYKANIDDVEAIKHGTEKEKQALDQLATQENIEIRSSGLFIDPVIPFLGATPDGLTGNYGLIEIKCPITAYKMGLQEAIDQKKVNFWIKDKHGHELINKNHNWFYQIQGQLHVARKNMCLFGVWFSEKQPLKTEVIFRDDDFFEKKMKEKLVSFYMECILPELVDPRHNRNLSIRDPQTIIDAIEKKVKKKSSKTNKENRDANASEIINKNRNDQIPQQQSQSQPQQSQSPQHETQRPPQHHTQQPTSSSYLKYHQF